MAVHDVSEFSRPVLPFCSFRSVRQPPRDAAGNLIVASDHYMERMGVRGFRLAVLEVDLRAVAGELDQLWPTTGKLDEVRQRALIHMAFNMGGPGAADHDAVRLGSRIPPLGDGSDAAEIQAAIPLILRERPVLRLS